MKKITLILAALFLVGAGCTSAPASVPPVTQPPAPQPAPSPAPAAILDPQGPEAKTDLIKVESLQPNEVVSSPLSVTGQARGTWYFEATFPVQLLDGDGVRIASGIARAQGDWMTEAFVPFKVDLTFTAPSTVKGTLVLKKDNPSGLPERDDEMRFPVRFTAANAPSQY